MMKKVFGWLFLVSLLITGCKSKQPVVIAQPAIGEKIVTYAITFDVGKAIIKPEGMVEIERIKKIMDEHPSLKFEVQGHTDSTGKTASNQKLSEERASVIVDKLVELGIDRSRLESVGKGESEPIDDNATEEGRAKNRRVVFLVK